MKSKIVPVKNIARLSQATQALIHRAPGAPGIGLVKGVAGYGKSTATAWLHNQVPSIYVRAMRLWTPAAMLGAILKELRLPAGGSCAGMATRAIEALTISNQTLFVDEADYIVGDSRLIETLRDFHDMSLSPVILIGEEQLDTKIKHLTRFASRVAQSVSFEALDLADTQLIARELCEVEIRDDLLQWVHQRVAGNCRYTVVALAQLEQGAKAQGKKTLGLAEAKDHLKLVGDAVAQVR